MFLGFRNAGTGKHCKGADNKAARDIPIAPRTVIVADRIYSDYGLLNLLDSMKVFFVVRHKSNMRYVSKEELDLPENTAHDVLIDEEILPQIKQLLRIKSFVGTSRNAVKTQIWTALATMLILIAKQTASACYVVPKTYLEQYREKHKIQDIFPFLLKIQINFINLQCNNVIINTNQYFIYMSTNNILTFKIGDETRPKIENLIGEEGQKVTDLPFFYEVYEKALTLIAEILQQNTKAKEDNNDKDLTQERNNIIAFVGDRGTGKTSSMKTIYNVLKNGRNGSELKYEALNKIYKDIKSYRILTLPTIDPSYFEERHNILDIVIAHMFDSFYKEYLSNCSPENKKKYKQDLIKKFQKVKSCIDIKNKKLNRSDDSIENLSALANGINLKDSIKELIESYLKFFDKSVLVIAIDDIDLQTQHAYEMVEQVRKYLIQSNVLILMGVKISQLNDLVKQYYYNENKELISAHLLTDTTENMAGRYLSKLIPFNQRIFMPRIGEHHDEKIEIVESGAEKENTIEGNISSVVLNLIFIKTRYLFYHTDITPSLIVPSNLRDLLHLLSLLCHMEDIPTKQSLTEEKKENLEEYLENKSAIIQKNRLRFRNYFIDTWCCEKLSPEMYAFIKELEVIEVVQINKRVIDFLVRLNRDTDKDSSNNNSNNNILLENDIVQKGNFSCNVSLGDVCYILNKLSNNYEIPYISKFVFAIKTIYSFFLYQLFEETKNDISERVEYLQLQYNMTKQSFSQKHLRKMTKLMVLTGYEKLLAGNLMGVDQISYYFRQKNNEKPSHPLYHVRDIDNELLMSVNEYIQNNYNKTDKVPFMNVEWDMLLKIWEFFILTSYNNTNWKYYRSDKACYYLHIPKSFPLNFDSPIIYSSTAILFNLIKFYDCYKLYYQMGIKGNNLESTNWALFWDIISKNYKHSLLWEMFYFDNYTPDKGEFINHSLEKIFIRNMEVLDTLDDYLSIEKKVRVINDEYDFKLCVKPYADFFDSLKKFQFQLYPKTKKEYSGNKLTDNNVSFAVYEEFNKFLLSLETEDNARELFCKILKLYNSKEKTENDDLDKQQ